MDSTRLHDVATVRSGYPFRSRLNPVAGGLCQVVQMKDVTGPGRLRHEHLSCVHPPPGHQAHVLHPGDVLVAARGIENRAVTFAAETGPTIAAANLVVLRPRPAVLPDYLAWFLNLPATQAELKARRLGSSVPFLPVSALGDLHLPVPPIELQQRIVAIYQLSLQETELLTRLRELRRTLVDESLRRTMCTATAQGTTGNGSDGQTTL